MRGVNLTAALAGFAVAVWGQEPAQPPLTGAPTTAPGAFCLPLDHPCGMGSSDCCDPLMCVQVHLSNQKAKWKCAVAAPTASPGTPSPVQTQPPVIVPTSTASVRATRPPPVLVVSTPLPTTPVPMTTTPPATTPPPTLAPATTPPPTLAPATAARVTLTPSTGVPATDAPRTQVPPPTVAPPPPPTAPPATRVPQTPQPPPAAPPTSFPVVFVPLPSTAAPQRTAAPTRPPTRPPPVVYTWAPVTGAPAHAPAVGVTTAVPVASPVPPATGMRPQTTSAPWGSPLPMTAPLVTGRPPAVGGASDGTGAPVEVPVWVAPVPAEAEVSSEGGQGSTSRADHALTRPEPKTSLAAVADSPAGTAVVVGLTALAGGAAGAAGRMVAVNLGCQMSLRGQEEAFPIIFHPTQMVIMGSKAAGAVVGNLAVVFVLGVLHGFAAYIIKSACSLFASGFVARTDMIALVRFPSAELCVFQVLLQGTSLGTFVLLYRHYHEPRLLAIGLAGLLACIIVPLWIYVAFKAAIPTQAFYKRARHRGTCLSLWLGPGEWLSRRRHYEWTSRYLSSIWCFTQARVWFSAFDMTCCVVVSALLAVLPATWVGCGHMRMLLAGVFTVQLHFEVRAAPHVKHRDALTDVAILTLQAVAMVLMGVAYYNEDPAFWTSAIAEGLMSVAMVWLLLKVVVDCAGELYVVLRHIRRDMQEAVWREHEGRDDGILAAAAGASDSDDGGFDGTVNLHLHDAGAEDHDDDAKRKGDARMKNGSCVARDNSNKSNNNTTSEAFHRLTEVLNLKRRASNAGAAASPNTGSAGSDESRRSGRGGSGVTKGVTEWGYDAGDLGLASRRPQYMPMPAVRNGRRESVALGNNLLAGAPGRGDDHGVSPNPPSAAAGGQAPPNADGADAGGEELLSSPWDRPCLPLDDCTSPLDHSRFDDSGLGTSCRRRTARGGRYGEFLDVSSGGFLGGLALSSVGGCDSAGEVSATGSMDFGAMGNDLAFSPAAPMSQPQSPALDDSWAGPNPLSTCNLSFNSRARRAFDNGLRGSVQENMLRRALDDGASHDGGGDVRDAHNGRRSVLGTRGASVSPPPARGGGGVGGLRRTISCEAPRGGLAMPKREVSLPQPHTPVDTTPGAGGGGGIPRTWVDDGATDVSLTTSTRSFKKAASGNLLSISRGARRRGATLRPLDSAGSGGLSRSSSGADGVGAATPAGSPMRPAEVAYPVTPPENGLGVRTQSLVAVSRNTSCGSVVRSVPSVISGGGSSRRRAGTTSLINNRSQPEVKRGLERFAC